MDFTEMTKEELLRQNEELRRLLSEANAANVAKETFLSNMSHDIRTPMNAIVGMTALAKKHIDEKSRVMDALNKIDTASTHLLSLINDVLDMSRINSGKMQIVSEKFSLCDLIHDVMTIIRPQMSERGHNCTLIVDDIENENFYGDPLRIRQVLVNILSNAAKYTSGGGEIVFTASEKPQGDVSLLEFICEDNGVGMDEDFVARIFEPFERVNNSTISKVEGTGLGMSIVKKIVDAMKGSISVKSSPGKGTVVDVVLPLKPLEEEIDISTLLEKRILVIESDNKLAARFDTIFGEYGIDHTIVPSASEALSAITDTGFGSREYNIVVIGDEQEGGFSVLETASYLTGSNPNLTAVLVSSDNWEEIEYQAERSGITMFIPVPFFRKSLVNGLVEAIHKGAGPQEASAQSDLSQKHILLVEDNLINREIAKEILTAAQAEVDTAEDGKQAVDMFEASEPGYYNIILMDVQMPVMDGYTATKMIRQSGRSDSGLPIFAMTANTFAEDIAKAKAAGMNGHIAKPVDINDLIQTVRHAVSADFSGEY